ncbi:ankyrin repeat domain-containing protein [Bordetella petrii]|uniref:ankyrin repeat domain-containing protein n=1 Tax=Bordetella petrii TaxID=94624 RepID=UPI003732B2AB
MLFKYFSFCLAVATTALACAAAGAAGDSPESRLRQAAASGDAAQVRALLAQGADIEARDARGRTPLLIATHHGHAAAARALIEAGADVNAKDAIQDSPYLYAGARGLDEILALTLAHGADLESVNRYGGTALIPAAERGHVATVRTLIEVGVAVDHVNNLGWTALLEAIILGDGGPRHARIVQLLVDAGADPGLADGQGVTPLAHARQRGYADIGQILLRAGARP